MDRKFWDAHGSYMRTNEPAPNASLPTHFLPEYEPDSLDPLTWAAWRSPVLALVEAGRPANKMVATIWAGVLCEAIALLLPTPGAPLGEVLNEEAIALVANERLRKGRAPGFARDARTSLTRLQAVARGIPVSTVSSAGPARLPAGPGLLALHCLASDPDAFVSASAVRLLDELEQIRPRPWPIPLPYNTWKKFLAVANLRGYLVGYTWRKLRSERASEELLAARPAVEVIRSMGYTREHLNLLSRTTRRDVQDSDRTLRGPATMATSHPWTIKDFTCMSSPDSRRAKPTATAPARMSKAQARRLAAQYADSLTTRPEDLSPQLEAILQSWTPAHLPRQDWERARELTCDVMRRSHIRGAESFRKHLRLMAGLVAWAQRAGYPDRVTAILTGEAIDNYLRDQPPSRPNSSLATMRSDLRRIASHVNPDGGGPTPPMSIGHTDVKPPYTDADIYWILKRIPTVTHPPRRRAIQTAVASGLGAGLNSGDLLSLTRAQVEDHRSEGILIHVTGQRPRSVWLRRAHEDLLREGIGSLTKNEYILGRRQHKDTVRDLYDAIQPLGDGPRILQGRLRNTWIATLMCEPIPVQTLLQAAGLEGARTLTDIAPYIHAAVDPQVLRGVA